MAGVHQRLSDWMAATQMQCRVDALGNLIGRYAGSDARPRVFMIGSHLDTVVDAGKFDGTLGVLLGLSMIELLSGAEIRPSFSVDVVGFSEEEGVRYRTPFLGSRAIAGAFQSDLLELKDDAGRTVRMALDAFGVESKEWETAAYSPGELIGFLEPHIEQGPVLDQAAIPLGIVTAIAGQTRVSLSFKGAAGHAGTVPHDQRKDALAAAAEFILGVEQLGRSTDGLVATVGAIRVDPGLSNVIAGQVSTRVDLRHVDDQRRQAAFEATQVLADEIARRRGLVWTLDDCQRQPAVQLDDGLAQSLCGAMERTKLPVRKMVSGAGHDAVVMSQRTPASMLFLRCRGGISHHPEEHVSEDVIAEALKVMLNFVGTIDG